jgi:hypothetical protein
MINYIQKVFDLGLPISIIESKDPKLNDQIKRKQEQCINL